MLLFRYGNFHVDFTNFIDFAVAAWESVKPAPYFEGSKMQFL